IERHGGFDTWVSNAGVGVYAKLEDLGDEDRRRLFDTNYWGVVHCATEALPHLKHRGGALITTGSISSQMPAPVLSSYTASKYAVKGYIDSLRLELMHEGTRFGDTDPAQRHQYAVRGTLAQPDGRAVQGARAGLFPRHRRQSHLPCRRASDARHDRRRIGPGHDSAFQVREIGRAHV